MPADPPQTVTVRPAQLADAEALAAVHVAAWQGAYRGLMPDDYLDQMDVARWTDGWRRMLTEHAAPLVGLVGDEVQGFVGVGPLRDPVEVAAPDEDPGLVVGELYAINVHPRAWGRGVGPALLAAGEAELRRLGFAEAVLWVLPANARARRFYERSGWADDGVDRRAEVNGVTVPERRYTKRWGQPSTTR